MSAMVPLTERVKEGEEEESTYDDSNNCGSDGTDSSEEATDHELIDPECGIHQAEAPASAPPAKPRLYVLDNAKFFLIICVVFTHFLAPVEKVSVTSKIFEGFRFVFMMPAFTFISGYCSSVDLSTPHKLDGTIKVAAIYILAQAFWLALSRYPWWGLWETTCFGKVIADNGAYFTRANPLHGEVWMLEDWGKPWFQLWYLFSLIFWRVWLPFWWRLRYPLASAWVTAAIFCSWHVYHADPFHTWMLDLNYIIAWFPVFCLGVTAKQRAWKLWDDWRAPFAGLAILLAFGWIPVLEPGPGMFGNGIIWAYGTGLNQLNPIVGDGMDGVVAKVLLRLAVPLVHSACIWGFLHIVPRGELRVITGGGERCMANYIFHPLSGLLMSYLGVYGGSCHDPPWWGVPAIILFSVVSSLFWTSPWVWKAVRPMCDPPVHLLLASGGKS